MRSFKCWWITPKSSSTAASRTLNVSGRQQPSGLLSRSLPVIRLWRTFVNLSIVPALVPQILQSLPLMVQERNRSPIISILPRRWRRSLLNPLLLRLGQVAAPAIFITTSSSDCWTGRFVLVSSCRLRLWGNSRLSNGRSMMHLYCLNSRRCSHWGDGNAHLLVLAVVSEHVRQLHLQCIGRAQSLLSISTGRRWLNHVEFLGYHGLVQNGSRPLVWMRAAVIGIHSQVESHQSVHLIVQCLRVLLPLIVVLLLRPHLVPHLTRLTWILLLPPVITVDPLGLAEPSADVALSIALVVPFLPPQVCVVFSSNWAFPHTTASSLLKSSQV